MHGRSFCTKGFRWIRLAQIRAELYSASTQSSVLTIHKLGSASKTVAELKIDSRAMREIQGLQIVNLSAEGVDIENSHETESEYSHYEKSSP